MSKTSGSYESIIRGVSEQVAENRREGQHYEQVNMISDPVRGLARRHGSLFLGSSNTFAPAYTNAAASKADAKAYRVFPFVVLDTDYDFLYRTQAKPAGSDLSFAAAVRKSTGAILPTVRAPVDPLLDLLEQRGASAIVNVGRYLFIAANDTPTTYSRTDAFNTRANTDKGVVWIRSGAYSRKYTISVGLKHPTLPSVTLDAEYTTNSSSYPNALDTSDIPFSDPEYQKKVNDRVNAYNSAVTAWIGTAAANIVPASIAAYLVSAFQTAHPTFAGIISSIGSTVTINTESTGYTILDLTSADGGDGTLMRAVGNEVTSVDRLSALHWVGKVVRIRPEDSTESYFMVAEPRIAGSEGWAEVTWREGAAAVVTPLQVLAYATIHNGSLFLAGSAATLASLVGNAFTVPDYVPQAVGDATSSPLPRFLGGQIDYLDLFQDRLVIVSGSTVFMSRPGDYLNWFRASVLTVADDDPVPDIYALGSENDRIRHGARFDRSLVLFGHKRQYIINGKTPATPSSTAIVTMSTFEDAIDAPPIASGNFVFYAKSRNGSVSLHQIQTGLVADAPESYEVSSALDTYIPGKPIQMLPVTTPNTIFLRTTGVANGFFLYTFLDTQDAGQRVFDSWSRWEWHETLGDCIGHSSHEGNILVYTLRRNGPGWLLCSDQFTLDTKTSERPYADSLQTLAQYQGGQQWRSPAASPEVLEASIVAFDSTVRERLLGSPIAELAETISMYPSKLASLWVGTTFPAYVTPTNPYVRDSKGKAITTGRHVITKYVVSVKDTGGLDATLTTPGRGEYSAGRNSARTIGRLSAELGIQPVTRGTVSVPVGREVTAFEYTLHARTWLPLTISAIEWVGQFFLNVRRS